MSIWRRSATVWLVLSGALAVSGCGERSGQPAAAVATTETASGLDAGETVPAYTATKCAGIDDGVAAGTVLCYPSRLGNQPVVMVFAKTPSDALAGLVKELDKQVAANRDKQLAAVVNFLGEPTEEARAKIQAFATQHALQNVALVLTTQAAQFKIRPQTEVTVMHYKDKTVAFKFVSQEDLDDQAIGAIILGLGTILD